MRHQLAVLPSSPASSFFNDDDAAEEENRVQDDDILDDLDEEDEGEDLFGPGMESDYRQNARLDDYDIDELDTQDYDTMDVSDRHAAEAIMSRRDAEQRRIDGRVPAAFIMDDEPLDLPVVTRQRRVMRNDIDPMAMMPEEEMDVFPVEALQDVKARNIAEWVTMSGPRKTIANEFSQFLKTFVDERGTSVYGARIKRLGEQNLESLEVSYTHLAESKSILAYFLANAPTEMLAIFDTVAHDVVKLMWQHYDDIHPEVHVRITDLPAMVSLRDLRRNHINCLVRVTGVVTRRTGVFPQLKYVKFNCVKCGMIMGPFSQDAHTEIRIQRCASCQSRGPFEVVSEQTVYRNYQKLTLQESPSMVPPGRLPRHREVILLWDLVDTAKPGEEIEVTGIYRNNYDASLNTQHGFPVFSTVIEANHINKKADRYSSYRLTEEDERAIRELARDERVGQRIIKSIAPSIYGHRDIKTGIALALFGGCPKDIQGKHRLRGDINMLMLGDPGTAKSQFLKYIEKVAHRAVFTTGQGASAVGLTASVRKDPVTREWTLEGGALVLADKGVCLIDEFDKMNDSDRTSIHEAMEQQSISISKAGIVTTLQARCAVIAAANPIRGRYNPAIPFSQNVELTEPILSRFDILCTVKDTVDPVIDEQLAKFVVDSHIRSHPEYAPESDTVQAPEQDADIIPQDLLRKYIMFAKDRVQPQLHQMDQDKVAQLYAELRRDHCIPITVRHIESMIRMSEAHARMHLREFVRTEDIDMAISVMLDSFIGAQKYAITKSLRRSFAKYLNKSQDHLELLLYTLGRLVQEHIRFYQYRHKGAMPSTIKIPFDEFTRKAREVNIPDVTSLFVTPEFTSNGFEWNEQESMVIKSL
ncbi:MCM-domain-containing protein [Syncephalis fuscata]|nr:MCM-domain-containing protein [Syncephalis fuscata]